MIRFYIKRASGILLALLLTYSCPILALANQACSVGDFRVHWPRLNEYYLTEILSQQGTFDRHYDTLRTSIYKTEAMEITSEVRSEFAELLHNYPSLCRLSNMKNTRLHQQLFLLLMDELEGFDLSLQRNQLSADYFARHALFDPGFAILLLKHLTMLGPVLHTLEITDEQKRIFDKALMNLYAQGMPHSICTAMSAQAFRHMMLLINQGENMETLEQYANNLFSLPEELYDQYLKLNPRSISDVLTFFDEINSNPHSFCYWRSTPLNPEIKMLQCHNKTITVPSWLLTNTSFVSFNINTLSK